jgi:hypothetical protein
MFFIESFLASMSTALATEIAPTVTKGSVAATFP